MPIKPRDLRRGMVVCIDNARYVRRVVSVDLVADDGRYQEYLVVWTNGMRSLLTANRKVIPIEEFSYD